MFQCTPSDISGGCVRGVTNGDGLPVQRTGTSREVKVNAPDNREKGRQGGEREGGSDRENETARAQTNDLSVHNAPSTREPGKTRAC